MKKSQERDISWKPIKEKASKLKHSVLWVEDDYATIANHTDLLNIAATR